MSSSIDVHAPQPLKINGLWQFFPEIAYQEGEADPPPLSPFTVRGDYKIERKERDIPVQRFLILKPDKGCTLPSYEEYAVEYPEKLNAGTSITFERKGRALRIRVHLPRKGFAVLVLDNYHCLYHEYVLYEKQVEGTWIPIEVDGDVLRP